jgi:hypothetical protein
VSGRAGLSLGENGATRLKAYPRDSLLEQVRNVRMAREKQNLRTGALRKSNQRFRSSGSSAMIEVYQNVVEQYWQRLARLENLKVREAQNEVHLLLRSTAQQSLIHNRSICALHSDLISL